MADIDDKNIVIDIFLKITSDPDRDAHSIVDEHIKVIAENPKGYTWWGNSQPFSPSKLEEFQNSGHKPKAIIVIPKSSNGNNEIEYIADILDAVKFEDGGLIKEAWIPKYYSKKPLKVFLKLSNLRKVPSGEKYKIDNYYVLSNDELLKTKLNTQYACGYVYRFNDIEKGKYEKLNSMLLFQIPLESKKLHKKVGISQYSDGVRIDNDFHDIFNPPASHDYVSRGKARKIKVLFNNKIFDAEYRYEGQTDQTKELQSIRFKKELKKEFEKVFPVPEGEFYIEQGADLNHFVFTHSSITVLDTTSDEEEAAYSEGKEFYRLHLIRERKPEVIRKAKHIFQKKHGRLFCEACKFDFTKTYGGRGEDFIEGHHKKLVSEMKDGDKTKPEDIAMLCSNCHRMIHRKPLISVEGLSDLISGNLSTRTNR